MKTMSKEETIVEHLTEFRKRLILVLLYFLVAFLGSLLLASDIYLLLTSQFSQKLIVLGPDDILWIYIQLASISSLVWTLPFMVYQIWAFVHPALTKKEARALLTYVPASFLCFVGGLAVGFFVVMPSLLDVLLSLGDGLFDIQITAKNYLVFVLHICIPVACLFELPVLVAFLTQVSILTPYFLIKYRRYAYFILLFIAVSITPADIVSDIIMTLPLILLYELSILVSWLIWKRKKGV